MGLRQPSRTATFFKQAAAGAQQQKEAREKLKKPQALGGAAAAGTQMVAATTGAQQQATQQVQQTAQEAATNLVSKAAPTQTAMAVAGATDKGTGLVNAPQTKEPIPGMPSKVVMSVASGEGGDLAAVQKSGAEINNAITGLTNEINAINDAIAKANAADQKVLLDERERLNTLLQTYRDKLSKENLGQIAGPSTFETEMEKREQLLASEGQNVGKLASIYGPRFDASKYGALASQVYGKDLEAIQQEAKTGLSESKRAKALAGIAQKEYTEKLDAGKKAYEKSLETETKKLDILKLTPNELSAYSRKELKELFGDQVDKLFKFDGTSDDAKATSSNVSAVRDILTKRKADLDTEKAKIGTEETKALGAFDESSKKIISNASAYTTGFNNVSNNVRNLEEKMNEIEDSLFGRKWSGWSKDTGIIRELKDIASNAQAKLRDYESQIKQAQKNKDIKEMNRLVGEMKKYNDEQNNIVNAKWGELSDTARRG